MLRCTFPALFVTGDNTDSHREMRLISCISSLKQPKRRLGMSNQKILRIFKRKILTPGFSVKRFKRRLCILICLQLKHWHGALRCRPQAALTLWKVKYTDSTTAAPFYPRWNSRTCVWPRLGEWHVPLKGMKTNDRYIFASHSPLV